VFAPSLFIGATTGACFGLLCNRFIPGISANPGVYAIVGMGAVVAGTTQGLLSAILIVYEMTNDYRIILPIMIAAGLASAIARLVDPDSIYHKNSADAMNQLPVAMKCTAWNISWSAMSWCGSSPA
jgi:CIC family chloride channel protein